MACDRRTFLKGTLLSGALAAGRAGAADNGGEGEGDTVEFPLKKARYVTQLAEKKVRCELCPRKCEVADRERGYCGVRENRDGTYWTLVWGRACSLNIDPIEKKPLFHVLPGTQALSTATAGCNMECVFCQNWEISQFRPEQVEAYYIPPVKMAELAKSRKIPSIAYTYSEPVVFFEYMYDCAVEANKLGIKNVCISNGYILEKPLADLCDVLTAVKIDLKAFTEDFYRTQTKGELKPVLDTLRYLARRKMWFEIVVLLIPTLNDSPAELKELCTWTANELGPDTPVHFTRYHPTYKLRNIPPTPLRTLETAHEIGKKAGLKFVYLGNVPGHEAESTYCPGCGKKIIHRYGYRIVDFSLKEGTCTSCGAPVPGVWR